MRLGVSLRVRLTLIILLPLLLIALGVGLWAFRDAEIRAADRFDRSLLSTALGISRDTAFSGGDALSEDTRDLLRDTSGGPAYYHVYAPDGVFVTGYATPPAPPEGAREDGGQYTYFDAIYRGSKVRTVQFRDRMTIDGLTGDFTFTVWQDLSLRTGFVTSLSRRTNVVMATLTIALALIVWFGVRVGLRPLLDLEAAIALRSAADLTPIRRPIPIEVSGIVGRLNALLTELSQTLRAKDDFISDAAHQLRNPIAGVLALADSVAAARSPEAMRERGIDLVEAARQAARLTEDLLVFERAKSRGPTEDLDPIDLAHMLEDLFPTLRKEAAARGVDFIAALPEGRCLARIDRVLFEQALINLTTNAFDHGGPTLSTVRVELGRRGRHLCLTVADDGVGVSPQAFDLALSRFGQISPSQGSGLGLPIAKAVAEGAGGTLTLVSPGAGLIARVTIPEYCLNGRAEDGR